MTAAFAGRSEHYVVFVLELHNRASHSNWVLLSALSVSLHKRMLFGTANSGAATEAEADRQKRDVWINSLLNKGNGAEEWRELIREGVRQSDPEQFPSASERDRMRGQGRAWYRGRS